MRMTDYEEAQKERPRVKTALTARARDDAEPVNKKKKFRLQDMLVKTVALVDTPAVQGSEFLVTKREEESMQPKGTQGAEDTETLHPRHARAVLSAVHTIEDAAVPSGYDSTDTPKMPKKVLDHVKGLREALRQHGLAKALEEDADRFEPLSDAERAWVAHWQRFPSERVLAKYLDERPEESALFEDIAKRLDLEREIFEHVSRVLLPELREFYAELDPDSRVGVALIVKQGMAGASD